MVLPADQNVVAAFDHLSRAATVLVPVAAPTGALPGC